MAVQKRERYQVSWVLDGTKGRTEVATRTQAEDRARQWRHSGADEIEVRRLATRWRCYWRDPSGQQRSRTFRTKGEAERHDREVGRAIDVGTYVDPVMGRTLFRDWAAEWAASKAEVRETTAERYRGVIRVHLEPRWGSRTLASITHTEVRRYVAELTAQGLAPRTVKKVVDTLGQILAAAVDARLVPHNVTDRVPLPRVEDEEMRCLTAEEVRLLAEAIDAQYRALVLVAGFSGLRMGEMVGLRRGRVDLMRGHVDVVESGVETGSRVVFGPPKTRSGRRRVALASEAVDALGRLLGRPGAAEDLVFTSPEGGVIRRGNFTRRAFAPAIAGAGLDHLRIHDLRHTAISLWIRAGLDPLEVARMAGHTNVAFTFTRYGHLMPDSTDIARGKLDAMLASVPRPTDARVLRLPGAAS